MLLPLSCCIPAPDRTNGTHITHISCSWGRPGDGEKTRGKRSATISLLGHYSLLLARPDSCALIENTATLIASNIVFLACKIWTAKGSRITSEPTSASVLLIENGVDRKETTTTSFHAALQGALLSQRLR